MAGALTRETGDPEVLAGPMRHVSRSQSAASCSVEALATHRPISKSIRVTESACENSVLGSTMKRRRVNGGMNPKIDSK